MQCDVLLSHVTDTSLGEAAEQEQRRRQ